MVIGFRLILKILNLSVLNMTEELLTFKPNDAVIIEKNQHFYIQHGNIYCFKFLLLKLITHYISFTHWGIKCVEQKIKSFILKKNNIVK